MTKKNIEKRFNTRGFPKQDLDSLLNHEQIQIRPLSDGKEFNYGDYKGCSIQLCIPGNPYSKDQQICISGEPEDVEKVVKEFHENYSWGKSLNYNPKK